MGYILQVTDNVWWVQNKTFHMVQPLDPLEYTVIVLIFLLDNFPIDPEDILSFSLYLKLSTPVKYEFTVYFYLTKSLF